MKNNNKEIRGALKKYKIYNWQLASKLGIAESTLNRKMRFELSEYEKEKFINAINEIRKEEEDNDYNEC